MALADYFKPAAPAPRPTLPEALSGLLLVAMGFEREDHGKLIEKFMDEHPEIGIHDPKAREAAFRAGYSAGHASGGNEASWDVMRHNDSPDCDTALAEYLEGLS
jgi:hypothetical protein